MQKNYYISIDTGGTFTDCVASDSDGKQYRYKILSNSSLRGEIVSQINPHTFQLKASWFLKRDILEGYTFTLLNHDFEAKVVSFDVANNTLTLDHSLPVSLQNKVLSFALTAFEEAPVLGARLITQTGLKEQFPAIQIRIGSTKGTNALLEMKGAKTAFFVTAGFKDLLIIGNQSRPDIFALNIVRPEPLYSEGIEIKEQIDKDGNVIEAIDISAIEEVAKRLKEAGISAIAICLKNAYRNNIHEKILKEILLKYFQYVNISTELSRQIKFLNRAETTVVNAYLAPIIHTYINNISSQIPDKHFKVMTSAGSLVNAHHFHPKDSLLSGPAGGVVGAAYIAEASGFQKIVTFDMGGTSTDVARYDGNFDYQFSQKIGSGQIFSPSLAIETVAAGGGSICSFDGFKLSVGPESAGSMPGPACYGAGGDLTITDVNLLLGRLDIQQFSIPVFPEKAEAKLQELLQSIAQKTGKEPVKEEILEGFRTIANEKMADTVRKISIAKGYSIHDYALVAFGGAGGLHACGIANLLNINTILLPKDAGLLSAFGIDKAQVERFSERSVLAIFDKQLDAKLKELFTQAEDEVINTLANDGVASENICFKSHTLYLRFKGQDSTIEVTWQSFEEMLTTFKEKYNAIFGHWIENRAIELESIRVNAFEFAEKEVTPETEIAIEYFPKANHSLKAFFNKQWQSIPVYFRNQLENGAVINGFGLLLDPFSTTVIEQGWTLKIDNQGTAIIQKVAEEIIDNEVENQETQLELFTNRFMTIAENMGLLLQRTALSVNVKERLDFSCALLDAEGELIANAPHIPVHLGSLGVCVRSVLKHINIGKGDVVVTNHPKFGGSHLPDITLISSVYSFDDELIGYVVNRCHHSEVGGVRPASMPPYSKNLAEEGVVISPMYLVKNGEMRWEDIKHLLLSAEYPTRAIDENLADLNAALAANRNGEEALQSLVQEHSLAKVHFYMKRLKAYSESRMREKLQEFGQGIYRAEEFLDNGEPLKVQVTITENHCTIDFTGSTKTDSGNLNANIAIVNSVVIYVLRLLLNEKIPLNDGILKAVELIIPEKSILNPDYPKNPADCPAVVGGNVELSQRLTDTLLKAFGIVASSQGTMNNFLFGNKNFGYYETICGGSGAGDGFDGTSGVHTHMTNTRITDAEIMELRYPVYLNRFEIRNDSAGTGKFKGGEGIVREVTFLEEVEVSLLRQHISTQPYGLKGGRAGKSGKHLLARPDETFTTDNEISAQKGDKLTIWTPGGGGFGNE
ncbi:hydantoinase B/oxoprolinase family protein [Arcicella lustrica]|uniref:Hydantoinase B/oxoprolinase family protein n=1 Tax=Arcicella lustrica TaxID=2984196 RepID=A0ABU5SN74_9BACT|nr:hydantoinase B/oxoprolinase family protein [Arcicella sp. DC25W]MEA5428721.1 hydantoinase B/oxoprolinase family protein [Arcicella sp. DC25W]